MDTNYDALMERLPPATRDLLLADPRQHLPAGVIAELESCGLSSVSPSDDLRIATRLPDDFVDYLDARVSPGGA